MSTHKLHRCVPENKEIVMKAHNDLPSPSWRDNDDAVDLKKRVSVIKIFSQTAQCFHSMVEVFMAFRAAFSCSSGEHVDRTNKVV